MLRLNISFLIYLSVVKISFCPKAPRMVLHYSYEKPRAEVIIELKADGKTCATGRGLFVAVTEGHPAYHRWH